MILHKLPFVLFVFFFLNDLFFFLLIEHATFFTTTHIIAYSLILMSVHWLVMVGFVPNLRLPDKSSGELSYLLLIGEGVSSVVRYVLGGSRFALNRQ